MYHYVHKSEETSKDNDEEIVRIGSTNKTMNDKLTKLEATVLEKASSLDVLADTIDQAKMEIAKAKAQNRYISQ